MKTVSFRDFVLGQMKSTGHTVEEMCDLCGKSRSTMYRLLSEPDSIDRRMLRLLHKYVGISYEDLIERK